MKSHGKSTVWPGIAQRTAQSTELEKELTKALDQSSSKLADRLDLIAQRFKGKSQTEHTA